MDNWKIRFNEYGDYDSNAEHCLLNLVCTNCHDLVVERDFFSKFSMYCLNTTRLTNFLRIHSTLYVQITVANGIIEDENVAIPDIAQ